MAEEAVERVRLNFGISGIPCYTKVLDEKLIHQFCKLAAKGLPPDGICDMLGVSASSLYRWRRDGEAFLEQAEDERNPAHAIFGHFVLETKKALSKYRYVLTLHAHDPFNKTRSTDLKILERRDRKSYSKNDPAGLDEQKDPDERFL